MTGSGGTSAIIYVRDGPGLNRSMGECLAYCERLGYDLASVVVDPDGAAWSGMRDACIAGRANVIVVARRDDLPADRTPRLEVVDETAEAVLTRLQSRRPRPVR